MQERVPSQHDGMNVRNGVIDEAIGPVGFREIDQAGRIHRAKRKAFTTRGIFALLGEISLIGPILIMTLHASTSTNLITVSVATLIFALVMRVQIEAAMAYALLLDKSRYSLLAPQPELITSAHVKYRYKKKQVQGAEDKSASLIVKALKQAHICSATRVFRKQKTAPAQVLQVPPPQLQVPLPQQRPRARALGPTQPKHW
ncbi:uncharacterized protein TrAtP1_008910 [Trichoderma atroviride]|uniref:uncharacterized protein n=1 Tax=Hypocrea atroviridis TaxID=63577 RepID=UPI0033333E78|nr:hypothetical protein TrAtP1_008910 [Trichoderma atroviride]